MRLLALAALAVLLSSPARSQQTTLLDYITPYASLHAGYAWFSKPDQQPGATDTTSVSYLRRRLLQDDLPTGGALLGVTVGVELVRGVSVVGRPTLAVVAREGRAVPIGWADLGVRAQLRLRDNYVAPYGEVSYSLLGFYPETSSRGLTVAAGVAYMHTLTGGLTLDVRYTPLEADAGFQYYDRLFMVSLGIVGFAE